MDRSPGCTKVLKGGYKVLRLGAKSQGWERSPKAGSEVPRCHALIPGPYSQSPSLLKASRRGLEGDILSCTDPPTPVPDSPVNSRPPRSNPRSSCPDLPIIPQPPNLLCATRWLPNGTHMSHCHTCHITPIPHSP